MTIKDVKKLGNKLTPKQKMEVIKKYFVHKGYECVINDYTFQVTKDSITKNCGYDSYNEKFHIDYSAYKYKNLPNMIEMLESLFEVAERKKLQEQQKKRVTLNFIGAINASGVEARLSIDDFYSLSITPNRIIKYKDTQITVAVTRDNTINYKVTTKNPLDFITASEFISIFNNNWEVAQF